MNIYKLNFKIYYKIMSAAVREMKQYAVFATISVVRYHRAGEWAVPIHGLFSFNKFL